MCKKPQIQTSETLLTAPIRATGGAGPFPSRAQIRPGQRIPETAVIEGRVKHLLSSTYLTMTTYLCILIVYPLVGDKNEVIHMKTKINKWGNSLGLRIPKLVAAEVGLEEDSLVNFTIVNGSIVISPERESLLKLEAMLNQVTEESLHGEVNTGPAIGREAW